MEINIFKTKNNFTFSFPDMEKNLLHISEFDFSHQVSSFGSTEKKEVI